MNPTEKNRALARRGFLTRLLLAASLFWAFGAPGYCQSPDKVLVVYYSRDGHTQQVAERLAQAFAADTERLIDLKSRAGPLGFAAAGKDAIAGNLTKLAPLKRSLEDYDVVLIGTPSWYGNVTPAVRTFIKENDLSGKKLGLFGTAHLTGVENALKQAAELINPQKASEIPVLPLRHRDLTEETLSRLIAGFAESLKLP